MSLWKWNDVELEIQMNKVDFQKKYENAFAICAEEEKQLQKIGKLHEISEAYCKMMFHLFDNIFGEGTADKLFHGEMDTELIEECYDSFLEVCRKDIEATNKRRISRVTKYKPKGRGKK